MSIAPFGGVPASTAGSPLAQSVGPDVSRANRAAENQHRAAVFTAEAAAAEGIAQSDGENLQAHDRDANGRRLWQIVAPDRNDKSDLESMPRSQAASPGPLGRSLDISG